MAPKDPPAPSVAAFRAKVERLSNLPTLPQLMDKVTRLIADPAKSMAHVGEEIAKDQVLASRLLKLVNSAFYGFPQRISTITHALVLLGYDAVRGLIVSTSVFGKIPPESFPLWRHSVATSLLARALGEAMGQADLEELAVAGLLHDLGKVIMTLEAPDDRAAAVKLAREAEMPLWRAEHRLLGFDHAEVGQWLCEKWKLPPKLSAPIGSHHRPWHTEREGMRVAIVAVADAFARGMAAPAEADLPLFPLDDAVEKLVTLPDAHLERIVENVLPQIDNLKLMTPVDR
jgi:putative nucleotidyltransferase with HDIG domain